MTGIYPDSIVSTIVKLNASFKRPVRPYIFLLMNAQRLSLYDTGADVCSKAFRRVFLVEQRPEKLNWTNSMSTA
jgi:hypothetical protein